MTSLINLENANILFKEIKKMINDSKNNVNIVINTEMLTLYWNIGKLIKLEILKDSRAKYGKSIVTELSNKLTVEYGRGYSKSNLFNMIKLFDSISNFEIFQTLSGKLSWSHLLKLITIDDDLKREFYITMCVNERWGVRTLKDRIGSMLYERTAISKKPELTIINDLEKLRLSKQMSQNLFLRDPYLLDFLGLKDTYCEKDLETAILVELEKFILEMGRDFAFLGRQVRITIGNKDYYIDLLFFHRKLNRLVLIELKLGEFLPEHKGQVELYLKWLQKNEMNESENSPIALILCADKNSEEIELLEVDKSGIHVAQYLTQLPPKRILQNKLHQAIQQAREKFDVEE